MLKSLALAGALLCLISPAHARPKLDPSCFISGPNAPVCLPVSVSSPRQVREVRGAYISRELGFGAPVRKARGGVREGREGVSANWQPVDRQMADNGRPSGCPARAWCGCWLASHLGISDRSLWLAANWAHIGHSAGGPQVGAIVVWRHHVGTISAVDGNRILVLSGNDGRAVRERWRTTSGVIAYRLAGG